ncbi:hypothetical protein SAMN05661080_04806 [Modestobacter sp. DSM 44400]|nr:hypothetical protein SAMN05661080_04806 [Modestobacter sp. DSM 44400]
MSPKIRQLGNRFGVSGVQTIRDGAQPFVESGHVETCLVPTRRWVLRTVRYARLSRERQGGPRWPGFRRPSAVFYRLSPQPAVSLPGRQR